MKGNDKWRPRYAPGSNVVRGWGPGAWAIVVAQLLVVAVLYRTWRPTQAVGDNPSTPPLPPELPVPVLPPPHAGLDAVTRRLVDSEARAVVVALRDAEEGFRKTALLDEDASQVQADGTRLPPVTSSKHGRKRISDTPWGAQHESNLVGVEDAHAELESMLDRWRLNATRDTAEAAARQRCVPSAMRGAAPADALSDLRSIPARLQHACSLAAAAARSAPSKRVGVVATTAADLRGLRRELLPWMTYHAAAGVSAFYVQYDGHDELAVRVLESAGTCVTLLHIHQPWADAAQVEAREAALSAAGASLPGGGSSPIAGNYRLMALQGLGAARALDAARADGLAWLAHVDPDEVLYPAGAAADIPSLLDSTPADFPAVRFMNHEAQAETDDVVNPYAQVTLFRVHKHWVTPEAHWHRGRLKLGDAPTFLLLYANGKSAVRVDAPGVRPLGPHFWAGDASPRWQSPVNPSGAFRSFVSDDGAILHYAYTREQDVLDKAARSCRGHGLEGEGEEGGGGLAAPGRASGAAGGGSGGAVAAGGAAGGRRELSGPSDASPDHRGSARSGSGDRTTPPTPVVGAVTSGAVARGATSLGRDPGGLAGAAANAGARRRAPSTPPADDKNALKTDCFIIDVDRDAFLAARAGPAAAHDFFMSRMALCEGSRIRCADAHNRGGAWCTIDDVARYTHVLTKLGLYVRIRGPSLLLAAQEPAIAAALRDADDAWMRADPRAERSRLSAAPDLPEGVDAQAVRIRDGGDGEATALGDGADPRVARAGVRDGAVLGVGGLAAGARDAPGFGSKVQPKDSAVQGGAADPRISVGDAAALAARREGRDIDASVAAARASLASLDVALGTGASAQLVGAAGDALQGAVWDGALAMARDVADAADAVRRDPGTGYGGIGDARR